MGRSGTPSPAETTRPRPIWLVFTDGDALRTVDVVRLAFAALALGAFLLTEVGRTVYRPFVYEAGIDDFGLADSVGNLGGIVAQVFTSLAILNSPKSKAFTVIAFLVVGYVAYEVVQPYLPRGVFDWNDIYGTLLGGAVSVLLVVLVRSVVRPNRVLMRL